MSTPAQQVQAKRVALDSMVSLALQLRARTVPALSIGEIQAKVTELAAAKEQVKATLDAIEQSAAAKEQEAFKAALKELDNMIESAKQAQSAANSRVQDLQRRGLLPK